MDRECSTNEGEENTNGKATRIRRPRHRWVDNIKIYLRDIGWHGVDWIDVAQDRDQWRALMNRIMQLLVL
jgi:hypothetical protein